jgi:hypothetical protein
MPPWLYHLNVACLLKMINDDLVSTPDKIFVAWRNPKDRISSCYWDAFNRYGHHFAEWTAFVRSTTSLSSFVQSENVKRGQLPHFAPVFTDKVCESIWIYDYRDTSTLIESIVKAKPKSWHALKIDNEYTRNPSINLEPSMTGRRMRSKDELDPTAMTATPMLDEFELPDIFRVDEDINVRFVESCNRRDLLAGWLRLRLFKPN